MIDRSISLDQRTPTNGTPTAVRYAVPNCPTTWFERFLLLTVVVTLPLENYYPSVAGMSSSFLLFTLLGGYIILNRSRILSETLWQPVFLAAYAFIVIISLLEFSSPLSLYSDIVRFSQMIGGAVCVAVLCRDRLALATTMYAYIASAVWVSIVLFSTGYETIQGMQAEDFNQAERIRGQAFEEKPLGADLNLLANTCTQGAVVAFAMSISGRLTHRSVLLLGIATFCLVASFLSMSRGAAVASLISFAVILYAQGIRQGKILILVSVLGMGVLAAVPGAIWSRMTYSTSVQSSGKLDARASLYDAALNRLPEYIVGGVGSGNFSQKWGLEKGFARHRSGGLIAQPTHNSPLQITVNWGILGLSGFLLIIWCVYRLIPLQSGRDELSLALLGVLVAVGLFLLQVHNFYFKSFGVSLGVLVGARRWIWPIGIVLEVARNEPPSGSDINITPDCHSR